MNLQRSLDGYRLYITGIKPICTSVRIAYIRAWQTVAQGQFWPA